MLLYNMDHTGSTYNYSNPSRSIPVYGYRPPRPQPVVSYHGQPMNQAATGTYAPQVGIQAPNDKINPHDIYKEKKKKKKNEDIEGDTIPEIVNNIILEKPNLKILRKAFIKIVSISEEEKEANLIF